MTTGFRVDLHVHSRYSPDSRLELRAVGDQVSLLGLQGFALTDHNTIDGHRELREIAREFPRLLLVPGVEVSTEEGHLLIYGVSELPPVRRPLAETIDWARAHGAIAALAHPLRLAHGVGRRLTETVKVPVIETANGHNSELDNAKAAVIAAHRGIPGIGGSDGHDVPELGRSYTELPTQTANVDDFMEELRTGRVLAGGTSLSVGGRVRLTLHTSLRRAARGFRPI